MTKVDICLWMSRIFIAKAYRIMCVFINVIDATYSMQVRNYH